MSSNETQHLALHSWAAADAFRREEINENFSAVDAAVGALRAADAEALAAISSAAASTAASLASAAAAAVRVAAGSYTGTGSFGPSAPVSIDFGFAPKLVFLFTNGAASGTTQQKFGGTTAGKTPFFLLTRDMSQVTTSGYLGNDNGSWNMVYEITLNWTATGLRFHVTPPNGYTSNADNQLNASGTVYRWIAIG